MNEPVSPFDVYVAAGLLALCLTISAWFSVGLLILAAMFLISEIRA